MFFFVVKIVGFILKLNNSVFRMFSFCKASYEALEKTQLMMIDTLATLKKKLECNS